MTLPNFFIIGAAKSGSTSLYHYVKQHPQIYMSPLKEPKFFALAGEKLDFPGPGDQENVSRAITDIHSYRNLFQGRTTEIVIGEASVLYLYSRRAINHIRQSIPNAKLIAILRHPVDRAYSNFLSLRRQNHEPIADFSQALQQEEARIQSNWHPRWYYKQRGFYYAQLRSYFETFPRRQIKVYLYDDFCADPFNLLCDIFRFLGVDDTFIPDMSRRYHVSPRIPKSPMLHALMTQPNSIKTVLKQLLSIDFRCRLKAKFEGTNTVKPSLPSTVRQELIQTYKEDILELQRLIKRDLSAWLE